jgi:hypothetical protein
MKIDRETKVLSILVDSGEEAIFKLDSKAFVFEDMEDPTTIMLDYQQNLIIFKVIKLLS